MSSTTGRVYCHICESEKTAHYNAESDLECIECHSTFVEKTGQSGLSGFLEAGAEGAIASRAAAASEAPHASAVERSNTEGGLALDPIMNVMTPSGERADASTTTQSPTSPDRDAVIRRILEYPERRNSSIEELTNQVLGLRGQVNRRRFPAPAATRRVGANTAGPLRIAGADPLMAILAALGGINPGLELGGTRELNGNVPQDALADILHHILVNETSTPGAPPASEQDIEAITRVEVTPENVEELGGVCHISQEEFEVGGRVCQLQCKHAFVEDSIKQWLRMHNTCPVCREPINKAKEEADLPPQAPQPSATSPLATSPLATSP
jgi:ribosomal protein S27E